MPNSFAHPYGKSSPWIARLIAAVFIALATMVEAGTFDTLRAELLESRNSITNLHARRSKGMYIALTNAIYTVDFQTNVTDEAVLQRVTQFLPAATFGGLSNTLQALETDMANSLIEGTAITSDVVNSLSDSKQARHAQRLLAKLNKSMDRLNEVTDPWKRADRLAAARRAYDRLSDYLATFVL